MYSNIIYTGVQGHRMYIGIPGFQLKYQDLKLHSPYKPQVHFVANPATSRKPATSTRCSQIKCR